MKGKTRYRYRRMAFALAAVVFASSVWGCQRGIPGQSRQTGAAGDKVRIGLCFDSFVIERWERDRDAFVARAAGELGAEVNVQNANGDVDEQIAQIDYFIEKGMDVIVIVAADSERIAEPVRRAKRAGIKVIAYDRLIKDAGVDLYITFDNARVGEMMAETIVKRTSDDAKIFMMCGSPEDNNVKLVADGFHSVIDKTDREVVGTAYADNWLGELGFDAVSRYLDEGGSMDAVMCGNDDIASQVIRALSERRLAGEVFVVGQDADLGACQRVVERTQEMTVYKRVEVLARQAAGCAVKLARGEEVKTPGTISDGSNQVPYIGLEPIAITWNRMNVIIDDGFHLKEEIYLNVSRED